MNLPQGRFERFLSEEDFLEALATSMKRPGGELVTLSRGFARLIQLTTRSSRVPWSITGFVEGLRPKAVRARPVA